MNSLRFDVTLSFKSLKSQRIHSFSPSPVPCAKNFRFVQIKTSKEINNLNQLLYYKRPTIKWEREKIWRNKDFKMEMWDVVLLVLLLNLVNTKNRGEVRNETILTILFWMTNCSTRSDLYASRGTWKIICS